MISSNPAFKLFTCLIGTVMTHVVLHVWQTVKLWAELGDSVGIGVWTRRHFNCPRQVLVLARISDVGSLVRVRTLPGGGGGFPLEFYCYSQMLCLKFWHSGMNCQQESAQFCRVTVDCWRFLSLLNRAL